MTFKILSCDGGGIRGLITALLIQDLDKNFGVISKADGFAGTSTGALIALALANGVDIAAIVNLYQNEGGTIFEPNSWFRTAEDDAFDTVPDADAHPADFLAAASGPGIIWTQYVNDGLRKIAGQLLGGKALSDAGKLVVVNSARLWDNATNSWEPCTFSNANNNPYKSMLMSDAALATSAAPTYFPPFSISPYGFFADGGVFANNPAITAMSEAISGGYVSNQSDLRMLSLGTGISPQGIPPSDIPKPLSWGVRYWMWLRQYKSIPPMALLALTMDATAQAANHNASKILGGNYCRGNFALPERFDLDEWKQASKLVAWTQSYMKTAAWTSVKQWVGQNWT